MSGCQTTRGTGQTGKAAFELVKPISYCSTAGRGRCKAADTPETIRQIRVHNRAIGNAKKRWRVK